MRILLSNSNFLVYNNIIFQESPTSSLSISETDTDVTDIEHTLNPISSDNDLWLIILNCHQSQDPPRTLINAACSNFMPILAILATCYEVLFHIY